MAGASVKVRRASTPLSSPPPSPPSMPSYASNSPSSSYYTDDQSDSSFGNDHGFNDDSGSDSGCGSDGESESDSNHEEHCDHHSTTLETHCNGLTYSGKRCSRKAHVFDIGMLPVCRTHQWCGCIGQAGRCQATAECGRLCNRLAPHAPPYHLCDRHHKGTETLPCYITRLPTELRLMIFRYLLPGVITASPPNRNYVTYAHTAVLFVNHQFYEETTLLIYSELKFEAKVWPTFIELFGKRWDRESPNTIFEEPGKKLCQSGARRIRHLDIQLSFSCTQPKVKGVGGSGITYEEYELYQVRDTVRKLVEILSPLPSDTGPAALKRLSITPSPSCKQRWRSDEAIAAIFLVLEPFLALGPIENVVLQPPPRPTIYTWRERTFLTDITDLHKDEVYHQRRDIWLESMKLHVPAQYSIRNMSETVAALAVAYRKIEDFSRLIYKQDAAQFSGTTVKHAWTSSIFQGIERVLHIARVAYEDNDLECLQKIHEAILKRWVLAHGQQLQSLSAVAASVSAMFDGDIASRHEGYSEAFKFGDVAPVEHTHEVDDTWSELQIKSPMPKLTDPGLTFREDLEKVFIRKGGEVEVWLKSPAVIRQLRAYKQSNP